MKKWLLTMALALAMIGVTDAGEHDDRVDEALAKAKLAVMGPKMVAAPPVVVQRPVAGPLMNPSHNCPRCGRTQYIVNQMRGNIHSHRCNSCGTEWWHGNPGR